MSLPDLNLLVALNVLLEEGSVTAAARRMHLSAPAMSRTLGRICEAVGDPIMVRAGRNLVPTPRALELQEQVRHLVEQATRLFHSGEHFDLTGLERCFTLRADNVLVGDMAAKLLEALKQQAPHCTLRFVTEADFDDEALRRNRIDLFIGARAGLEPEVRTQHLFATHFVGLARRGHSLFDGEITPGRFAAYPQVSVSRRGRARGPIDEELEKLGLKREVQMITPSFHGSIFCLPESDLLLPIPAHALWRLERLGLGLRQFEIPLPLRPFNVIQAWHPRFDNDVAHRWLRDTVARVCLELCASSTPLA